MTSISSNLAESLRRSYETGEYADLYILCGGEKIAAHQLIVCSQSEVLRAACLDKDGNRVPSATIDLEHEHIDFVKIMIWFLYFATYRLLEHDVDEGTKHDSDRDIYEVWAMEVHAFMYVIANKYGIPALGHLARQCFEEAIKQSWDVDLFLESIPIVFDMMPETDRGLRDLVVCHGSAHLRDLMEDVNLRARLQELFRSHPVFAWEIFQRNFDDPPVETEESAVIVTPLSSEDSAVHTTELVQTLEPCICASSPDGFRYLEDTRHVFNSGGTRYGAFLFQTNTASIQNCCCLVVVLSSMCPCPQRSEKWYTSFTSIFGMMAKARVENKGDGTLDAALKNFYDIFQASSGNSWIDRKSHPKKGQYMYIEKNYQGMWLKQWPSRTIKENAALVDRKNGRKKNGLKE